MTDQMNDGLLKTVDVVAITRLSRTTLYRKRRTDAFPKPCQIGHGQLRWRRSDIDQWIEQLPTFDRADETLDSSKAIAKSSSRARRSVKTKDQPSPEQGRLL